MRNLVGDYAAWNYFQTIDRPENRRFVERFRARYGQQRAISDPMEATYFGVPLRPKPSRNAEMMTFCGFARP